MTDYIELKKAAEYAQDFKNHADEAEEIRALPAFYDEVDPADVLALIAENERLAELLECAQGDMGQAQKIMDRDMKDAERYRHIRKDGYRDVDTDQWSGEGEAMDAFVDDDMEEGQQ